MFVIREEVIGIRWFNGDCWYVCVGLGGGGRDGNWSGHWCIVVLMMKKRKRKKKNFCCFRRRFV